MAILLTAAVAITVLAAGNLPDGGLLDAAERLDCNAAVKRIINETRGRLLSVRNHGGQCIISILILRENERPRKLIIRTDPKRKNLAEYMPVLSTADHLQPESQCLLLIRNRLFADR